MSLSANLQKVEPRVFLKGEHQAAIVHLGELALLDFTAADLAAQTSVFVTQVLEVEYCLFWELEVDGRSLSLLAGSGEVGSSSTTPFLALISNSLEKNTLTSTGPVIFEKSRDTLEPVSWHSVAAQDVKTGISVRIGTMEKPYGILQVFSLQGLLFSQSDIQFLQSVANLVGLVLHQEHCQYEPTPVPGISGLRTKSTIQSKALEWDRYEIKNRLVEGQERERLRLAQDLHDVPIQDLYGLIYQLDDLRDTVKDPEGEKILEECNHTLHRVVNSLRTICRELRPPSLSPFGLEVAIRDHVEKFRDQNPDIQLHLDLMQDRQALSDGMRLTLFRIYQQAIHNVARHAQASDVHIRFRWDDESIILEVEDDGMGFEVPENWVELSGEEHFGLLGIAERIDSIRGKLEIVSSVGNGTLIRVIAPYTRNKSG
jgi:signal transduction histidine kinase